MADCRTQLVEAQKQIQTLREAIEKQEMEMNELRETHQADQQYIVSHGAVVKGRSTSRRSISRHCVGRGHGSDRIEAVKEDTQATQKQQLSLIQQLKARVLELEEEGKTKYYSV